MRFVPEFDSAEEALQYATTQGLDWIGSTAAGQAPCLCFPSLSDRE